MADIKAKFVALVSEVISALTQTTEKMREIGEFQAGGLDTRSAVRRNVEKSTHNGLSTGEILTHRAGGSTHNGRCTGETEPRVERAEEGTTTAPADTVLHPSSKEQFAADTARMAELQAGGPDYAPAAGKANSRFPMMTAPADTCLSPDMAGNNLLMAGGSEHAPAAGEASSRFPTETAPADTCQTRSEDEETAEQAKLLRLMINLSLINLLLSYYKCNFILTLLAYATV